jgi:hypothetical protein
MHREANIASKMYLHVQEVNIPSKMQSWSFRYRVQREVPILYPNNLNNNNIQLRGGNES